MRALTQKQAKELDIEFSLYKKDMPTGVYQVLLEHKVWCKLPAIHLLCRDIKTQERLSFLAFTQEKGKFNTKYKNFYGAKDCKIDFGDEKTEEGLVFFAKVEKNTNGNIILLEAYPCN